MILLMLHRSSELVLHARTVLVVLYTPINVYVEFTL